MKQPDEKADPVSFDSDDEEETSSSSSSSVLSSAESSSDEEVDEVKTFTMTLPTAPKNEAIKQDERSVETGPEEPKAKKPSEDVKGGTNNTTNSKLTPSKVSDDDSEDDQVEIRGKSSKKSNDEEVGNRKEKSPANPSNTTNRLSNSKEEPRLSPAKTEPRLSPAKTEPRLSPAKTETRQSPAKTETRLSPAKTEPRLSPAKTETRQSPAKTEPRLSPVKTEPWLSPAKTESRLSPGRTDPGASQEKSDVSGGRTEVDDVVKKNTRNTKLSDSSVEDGVSKKVGKKATSPVGTSNDCENGKLDLDPIHQNPIEGTIQTKIRELKQI